jgi:hypothetical protein
MIESQVILDHVCLFLRVNLSMGKANSIVTGTPNIIPQIGRKYLQVYYLGEGYDDDGGGGLMTTMDFGVRYYEALITDEFKKLIAVSRSLLTTADFIKRLLHNKYDITDVPLQAPIKLKRRSQINRVNPSQPEYFIDVQCSVKFMESFQSLKETISA